MANQNMNTSTLLNGRLSFIIPNYIKFLIALIAIAFILPNNLNAQCNAIIGSSIDPTQGCDPLPILFGDLSQGFILSTRWDFGDGSPIDSSTNPLHTFYSNGKLIKERKLEGDLLPEVKQKIFPKE